jgi:hypothetical protein
MALVPMPKLRSIAGKPVALIEVSNMLDTLNGLRRRIENGEVTRFGLVECRSNGDYSTEFTSAMHKREDAAMLIDLALRLMGFVSRNKHDDLV